MNTISFKGTLNTGDWIYYLSGIKSVCEKHNAKAKLYLWLDRIAFYYTGATHPVKDITGKKDVSMNAYMFKMLKPLLEAQPYIESVETWNGEPVMIDLDRIRQVKINQPYGDIRQWPGYVYTDMCCDIAIPALILPEARIDASGLGDGYIVANRTERYNNELISYFFLKDYPVFFVGVPKEYHQFKKQVPQADHIQPQDFLVLAQIIDKAKLFVGNQSMCFAIAEQLKTPRVLEVSDIAPNVITCGENGYGFYDQKGAEYFVSKLWKGEKP